MEREKFCVAMWLVKLFLLAILLGRSVSSAQAQPVTLTFDAPQTAGMSGLRAFWDSPVVLSGAGKVQEVDRGEFGKAPSAIWAPEKRAGGTEPGALVFDAVHRALLVRFPGSAQKIAAQLNRGFAIEKVELLLPFKATELWPEGYADPAGLSFIGKQWAQSQPRWHAVAWALRKPWRADAKHGPTYNAHINGAGYWAKYGARDEQKDRFPTRFGPAEVSQQNQFGRVDVTAFANDAAFGSSSAERLRRLEYCGFLVKKQEIYDVALWQGSYEWTTARGGQGILIDTPQLAVTFVPAKTPRIMPAYLRLDVTALAAKLRKNNSGGVPTAIVPGKAEFARLQQKFAFTRPAWMPVWQWQRVQELASFDKPRDFPTTYADYLAWLDAQLARPPRSWYGFDAAETTQNFLRYEQALPQPLREHWKLYWWSWLMPDRPYEGFEYQGAKHDFAQGYIGGVAAQGYYGRTGDWRGNFSVYRTYARDMGTMNFNHWAIAGVLLGGRVLDSEAMMKEGRAGLEALPLRLWSWYDGTTQESIDHYYFAESLTGQKVFADFGPAPADRMMGHSMLGKSVEELASVYHPGLRRFVSSSGRTGIAYLLGIQDGLQGIVHTLSPQGAYTDWGVAAIKARNVEEMPSIGHNFKPGQVAQQTLNGAWAPEWFANIVDNKPLPYEMTAAYKQWGAFYSTPLWRKTFLGHNYGLGSLDVSVGNETVPVMAQWRREPKPAASMTDLGTLLIRPGINRTELLDSIYHDTKQRNPNGSVGTQGSPLMTMQHRNKAIVLTSPFPGLAFDGGRPVPEKVTSLQTTVALFNFQQTPTWELFVDGQKVTQFPHRAKFGSKITMRDGVSFLALIPIPATDLGRDREVEIVDDGVMTEMQGGGKAREALRINAYNYRSDTPLDIKRANVDMAYAGYVVELGDVNDYGSFEAFQKHIQSAQLSTQWDAAQKALNLDYKSGTDTLELSFKPDYVRAPTDQAFPVRKVNGAWPYLAPGVERDSILTQQGTSGRLEKNGAQVITEAGHMAYLQTEPRSGTYAAFNPFSDAVPWEMRVAGGIVIKADGPLGMARVTVRPSENKLWIAYDTAAGAAKGSDLASSLLLSGFKSAPLVEFNGQTLQALQNVTVNGSAVYVVPLRQKVKTATSKTRVQSLKTQR